MRTWPKGMRVISLHCEDGGWEGGDAYCRPLWALPYFSPSCQGTTGLLANLNFSIDGRPLSSCLGCSHR